MVRTHPLVVSYDQCLGAKEDPLSFASLYLEDLRNGRTDNLSTMQQLVAPCQRQKIPHPALLCVATSRALDSHDSSIPCGLRSGGYCHPMESFIGHLTPSSIVSHAREGVWSYEGVMWPDREPTRVASTGFLTPCRLPLVNWMTWPRLPLHLPSTHRLQKFILSFQDACGHVGVGRGSQQQQPMRIRPAWLPAQRPGRGQRPIEIRRFLGISLESTSLWGVPQWSILRPSCAHSTHSSPTWEPMRIQIARFAWTTLKSGGYISWPGMTPDRIRLPTVRKITSLDSASPHLLFSNPLPSPSLDRLLGNIWLIPQERQGKLEGRGLESSTRCHVSLAQTRG